ncbi:hypothetical protein [Dankookia sp. P2]|uniref:hypothetical protein n=1 Tax=Dankookia sp. P2 TaxID=3423955 RepID=UPI003D66FEB6
MTIRGSIDEVTPLGAAGWVHDDQAGEPLLVQAMINGAVIGETIADVERPDLANAGLGDGRCGFHIAFGFAIDPSQLAFVSVKPSRGDAELPRTNLTGFVDAFRAMRARHPGVGWTRSIFGGLWTDRVDARRRLAGRVAIGAVAPETAAPLGRFIEAGHVLLPGALAPAGPRDSRGRGRGAAAGRPAGDARQPRCRRPAGGAAGAAVPRRRARLCCAAPSTTTRWSAGSSWRAAPRPLPSRARRSRCPRRPNAPRWSPASAKGGCCSTSSATAMRCPNLTPGGESRWLAGSEASLTLASAAAASIETLALGACDLAIIAPGTVYRLRVPAGMTALVALASPNRQTPLRFLRGDGGEVTLRHASGATLTV